MCITWCHRRHILYWNHDSCHPVDCSLVNEKHGQCEDCRHWVAAKNSVWCNLTRAALPDQGGCCHWNVEVARGPQKVTRDMLILLAPSPSESELVVLNIEDVPYQSGDKGELYVNPDELGLPYTYGLGTDQFDQLVEEVIECPEWEWSMEA